MTTSDFILVIAACLWSFAGGLHFAQRLFQPTIKIQRELIDRMLREWRPK